jgi:hypothetical protein
LNLPSAVNQSREHLADLTQIVLQGRALVMANQLLSTAKIKDWHTLKCGSPRDSKEISSISFMISAIAFSDICGNRQCGPIQLVSQIVIPPREFFRKAAYFFGKCKRLLVNLQILEEKSHTLKLAALCALTLSESRIDMKIENGK